jgi:hypothetical protein
MALSLEAQERKKELENIEQLKELPIVEPDFGESDEMYSMIPDRGSNGLYGLELNEGLTDSEVTMAEFLAPFIRGVMIVHGQPGCGKGVVGTYLAWQGRRLFKKNDKLKNILLDYKPKKWFDYSYNSDNRFKLFDAEFMINQINIMAEKIGANIKKTEEIDLNEDEISSLTNATKSWAKKSVLFDFSILELDELKRYCHNRRPHNPFGIMIGNIVSVWRHLDMLVLGMCPNINEIDVNNFLRYVTHEVEPGWCTARNRPSWEDRTRSDTTKCVIRAKTHIGTDGVIKFASKGVVLYVDGGKPRPEIGMQVVKPDFPMGIPEKKIVDFLLSQGNMGNLNEVSNAVGEELNECRNRLLAMSGYWRKLRDNRLSFNNIIRCKRIFDIYDSQDYKNLNPRMIKSGG